MVTSETPSSQRQFNTRLGLILFAFYLVLYLGFVLINAFQAQMMDTIVFAGLNLAIVYGFALIVIALVLALVYGFACRSEPVRSDTDPSHGTKTSHEGDDSAGGVGE